MGEWTVLSELPRPIEMESQIKFHSKGWDGLRNQIYNHMRREYQIRWNEEVIFRSDSWRITNAMLDKCPEDSYIYEDIFYNDEPYKE